MQCAHTGTDRYIDSDTQTLPSQPNKHTHAIKQASKKANKQTNKQANNQTIK